MLSILLSACESTSETIKTVFQGRTMGTQYHISLVTSSKKPPETTAIKHQVELQLEELNQLMSTYIVSSQISRFNQYNETDWFSISYDFLTVIKIAQEVSHKSNGAFDVTISPVVNLWGFGPEVQYKIPATKKLKEVMQHTGYKLLEIRSEPPALRKKDKYLRIDLSAIAKGFAVDKISSYLKQQGFNNFLVEIGGEIHARGKNHLGNKWRIAISQPDNRQKIVGRTLTISNQSVATSGDYLNYFVEKGIRFSHTIDPQTGSPIKHKLASVSVLNNSTMLADAYATALMVMGEEKGKDFVLKENLSVHMIIREKDRFKVWETIH